jgi:hypothetical protein
LEALNSVFSAVKRKARGFRSTDNLIAMLYFTAGKLKIPAIAKNRETPRKSRFYKDLLYHLFEITGFLGDGIFRRGKAEARGAIHR